MYIFVLPKQIHKHLYSRSRDLQLFLQSRAISSIGCSEKSDLVDLVIRHFGIIPDIPQSSTPSPSSSQRYPTQIRPNDRGSNHAPAAPSSQARSRRSQVDQGSEEDTSSMNHRNSFTPSSDARRNSNDTNRSRRNCRGSPVPPAYNQRQPHHQQQQHSYRNRPMRIDSEEETLVEDANHTRNERRGSGRSRNEYRRDLRTDCDRNERDRNERDRNESDRNERGRNERDRNERDRNERDRNERDRNERGRNERGRNENRTRLDRNEDSGDVNDNLNQPNQSDQSDSIPKSEVC